MKPLIGIAVVLGLSSPLASIADTLKKISDSGTATVGVRESAVPLSYAIGEGRYGGYHVEICQRVLADVQKQLRLAKLDIRYVPVTSQDRVPLLQNGTVDLECGATVNNEMRQKDVAFAPTTYVQEVRVAVKAKSGITSIAQLKGRTVVTTSGTATASLLRADRRGQGLDFKELLGKDHADSFVLFASGKADAIAMEGEVLALSIARSGVASDFRLLDEVLSAQPVAIMFRKDDPSFKKSVDGTIEGLMRSEEIAKIYDRWFMRPIPPDNSPVGLPPSPATRALWSRPNNKPAEAGTDGGCTATCPCCKSKCASKSC